MKKTQIDRAVESLEAEVRVLQLAIGKLKEQQAAKAVRVRRKKDDFVTNGSTRLG